MPKRKICVVVTARPSYSRIKSALKAIQEHPELELQLVIAGSALLDRYGNAVDFIEKDGFTIAAKVFMVLEGENPTTMAKTTGIGVMELTNVFYNLQPDAVVTIADRFETIATSIAAAYQNIPLVHIQGGEVTGSIDEKVRHANTKLSDLHLVSSDDARARVIKLGENPEKVINTGCPSIDLVKEICAEETLNFDPIEKYGGVGEELNWKDGYAVVMQHPVTTEYQKSREHITETLEAINKLNYPVFWFWPNVDAGSDGTSNGIRTFREMVKPKSIHFFKNMEPLDFLRLLKHSSALIGNSSAGIRECSYLGLPVVNIGNRQNRRLRGKNVRDVSPQRDEIYDAMKEVINYNKFPVSKIYGNGEAGKKIAEILASSELSFSKTINY
ncbi:UDP-N-acetylglucosamine 2-epimerase [Salegentibacter salegens]|uniref:UDP-N-acetylglucosamine 2-epimerase/UDP-N-acetyl-D-glucosamine 2-epimerase, UDP-hydrolysing,TIGR03568 n=1 Tax=Salegentibacter salegens TaxID=143223 RepID=A0A1M7NES3_9FLAO|nr:UDP-N-acetylglucosamine 2-epimerase [Salegentibacter salegens]PRX46295.1 UDP-N-acetylglucosamine 2-epimerase/UDP-hydrolysing UDP-N-acetyl-D-glucosamine 2-epimerase,TIGR03568 [Salegentibacter salegens]SHN02162.1 UDP-N-acetylglucosamine 2-epimerase/UDP-N-acetyl-D-glucosamine 2-epimerase, UDP-hydrolysing,TIGR03568 [Salegentibacter salegens]